MMRNLGTVVTFSSLFFVRVVATGDFCESTTIGPIKICFLIDGSGSVTKGNSHNEGQSNWPNQIKVSNMVLQSLRDMYTNAGEEVKLSWTAIEFATTARDMQAMHKDDGNNIKEDTEPGCLNDPIQTSPVGCDTHYKPAMNSCKQALGTDTPGIPFIWMLTDGEPRDMHISDTEQVDALRDSVNGIQIFSAFLAPGSFNLAGARELFTALSCPKNETDECEGKYMLISNLETTGFPDFGKLAQKTFYPVIKDAASMKVECVGIVVLILIILASTFCCCCLLFGAKKAKDYLEEESTDASGEVVLTQKFRGQAEEEPDLGQYPYADPNTRRHTLRRSKRPTRMGRTSTNMGGALY